MESTNIFMKHTSWTWKIWIHGLISIYFIICNCIALDYEVTRDLTDTFDKADIASCDSITGAEQDRTSQTKCKCLKDGTLTTNNDGSLFCIKDYGTSIGCNVGLDGIKTRVRLVDLHNTPAWNRWVGDLDPTTDTLKACTRMSINSVFYWDYSKWEQLPSSPVILDTSFARPGTGSGSVEWNALPKSLANGLQGYLLRILILCQGNNNGAAQTECVLVKVKGKRVHKLPTTTTAARTTPMPNTTITSTSRISTVNMTSKPVIPTTTPRPNTTVTTVQTTQTSPSTKTNTTSPPTTTSLPTTTQKVTNATTAEVTNATTTRPKLNTTTEVPATVNTTTLPSSTNNFTAVVNMTTPHPNFTVSNTTIAETAFTTPSAPSNSTTLIMTKFPIKNTTTSSISTAPVFVRSDKLTSTPMMDKETPTIKVILTTTDGSGGKGNNNIGGKGQASSDNNATRVMYMVAGGAGLCILIALFFAIYLCCKEKSPPKDEKDNKNKNKKKKKKKKKKQDKTKRPPPIPEDMFADTSAYEPVYVEPSYEPKVNVRAPAVLPSMENPSYYGQISSLSSSMRSTSELLPEAYAQDVETDENSYESADESEDDDSTLFDPTELLRKFSFDQSQFGIAMTSTDQSKANPPESSDYEALSIRVIEDEGYEKLDRKTLSRLLKKHKSMRKQGSVASGSGPPTTPDDLFKMLEKYSQQIGCKLGLYMVDQNNPNPKERQGSKNSRDSWVVFDDDVALKVAKKTDDGDYEYTDDFPTQRKVKSFGWSQM